VTAYDWVGKSSCLHPGKNQLIQSTVNTGTLVSNADGARLTLTENGKSLPDPSFILMVKYHSQLNNS